MFFKTNILKKLMKQSWEKAGLHIGSSDSHYYISGNWWIIKVMKGNLSNKERATIIEMIGEFPETGEAFKCVKDEENQYEVGFIENIEGILSIPCIEKIKQTKVVYQLNDYYRIMQRESDNICILVNNTITTMIDNKCVDLFNESPLTGPFCNRNTKMLMWENNMTKFICYGIKTEQETEEQELLLLLENIELE